MTNQPTTCKKCNGTGFLPYVIHVDGGRCWACGPGNDITYYTEDEANTIHAERLARGKARRAAAKAARNQA